MTKSEIGEFINKDQLWEHMGGTVTVSSVTKSEMGELINKDQLWEHMGGTVSSVTKSEMGKLSTRINSGNIWGNCN